MFHSFRAQITALALFAGAGAAVALVSNFLGQREDARRAMEAVIDAHARDVARDAGEFVRFAGQVVGYSARRAGRSALEGGRCDEELAAVRDAVPGFGNLGFIDRSGRLVCSVVEVPKGGVSFADAPWFRPALAAGGLHASGPFLGPVRGRWVSVLTQPVRGAGGEVIGLATLPVDLDRFAAAAVVARLPVDGFSAIVDREGRVIAAHPRRDDWMGRPLPDEALLAALGSAGPRAVPGRLLAVREIRETGWRAVVTVPEATVAAEASGRLRANSALVVAVTVAFLVALAWVVARLLQPLERLARTAREAAGAGGGVRAASEGPEEIRTVAHRLNDLLDARERADALLRESEAHHRALIEHSPDAIVVLDVDEGRFVEANGPAERLFGMPRQALLASSPWALSPERQPDGGESRHAAQARVERVLAGEVVTFEWRHRREGGEEFDCEVRLARLPAAGRRLVRGSLVDIGERKRGEERLARLTRLYGALSHTNEAIARAADPRALFTEVCRIAVDEGGLRMAWIGLVDRDTGLLEPVASAGTPTEYLAGIHVSVDPASPQGRGPSGTAIREGRLVVCNDFEHDEATAPWRERALAAGYRASASIPLRQGGEAVGAVNFYAAQAGFFDAQMQGLVEDMGLDLSFALDKMESDAERERAIVALVASESRLREMLESVTLAAVSLDEQGRVTFCNDFLLKLTGWSREEAVGADWFERFIAPGEGQIRQIFRDAMVHGEFPLHHENEIVTRQGERRLIRWSNTLIHAGGRIVGTTSLGEDVTLARRAEEALRESEARFRALIEGVPNIPVQGYDARRRVVFWNGASERLYGYTSDEARGRLLEELIAPPEMRGEVARGVDAWVGGGPPIPPGELRLVRKDGSPVDVFSSHVMVRNFRGEPEMFCIDVDLTQLHTAEAALRASEERFRTVVEGLSEGVMLVDAAGRVLLMNESAERLLGVAREDLAGQAVLDPSRAWGATREDGTPFPEEAMPLAVTLATGEACRDVVMGLAPGGRPRRWLEVSTRRMDTREHAGAVLVSFSDVTKRLAAEQEVREMNQVLERRVAARTAELETANRELESFSYSVSHDLRSPLRAIDGYSAIVIEDERERLSAGSRELLERTRTATGRMAQMIDDLLQLAQIGRAAVRREPTDLTAIATEIAADLSRKEPGRACEWRIAPGVTAMADPGLARTVMENLLSNAWRYTSRRELSRIEFGADTDRGGRQVFFVRDNGAGFDPAHAHRLFGAFQRLHTDREFLGHGIGLATVRRIVQRHGGRVWAQGAVDQGATFHFTLSGAGLPAARGGTAV